MKKLIITSISLCSLMSMSAQDNDVEMLAYSRIDGTGGMRLAWRSDKSQQWCPIGDEYTFVSSDFGPWGSHKKMYAPTLTVNPDGTYTATWMTDYHGPVIATAFSPDLCIWQPQTYTNGDNTPITNAIYTVNGRGVSGNVIRVPRLTIDRLNEYVQDRRRINALHGELMADDPVRFAQLKPLTYTLTANPKQAKPISDMLMGIFFEDINYGADGGLYAELVQNRDFEYQPSDRGGDSKWHALTAWIPGDTDLGTCVVRTDSPIHPNNPHYLEVNALKSGYSVQNTGYDGIAVKQDETYDLNIKMRRHGSSTPVTVALVSPSGKILSETHLKPTSDNWQDYNARLTPNADCKDARLQISADIPGVFDIDMVSLFPRNTFKGRTNGLRADMAQTLADLHPRFVRFPGGCVAHGDGVDNIYDWKGSIGPLEARKPLRNLWNYHQTRGLGYFEYFQFCEDIGAEPLPVLAAGVPCQNSGSKAHHTHDALTQYGQQCGIPMDEMNAYIQDILDLIEYANGDPSTTWGAKRAEAGHPEPFNLKYIGIGNEDMITEVFVPRFKMIYEAVTKAHPEIKVVGTVGPFYEGADYDAGWRLADELSIPLVDEHYYVSPGWMIYNQDFYDNYRRNATKVYLGEYAAHLPSRASNIETALAEALYLTSVERNGDVVEMTSYAPLFGKDNHCQWTPDLIYFNNTEVRPTVDYYTQMLFGQNSGSLYIPATTSLDTDDPKAKARVGSSIVYDENTKQYALKLVNLLPVEVTTTLDLTGLKYNKKAPVKCITLQGTPTDTEAKPVENVIKLTPKSTYTLPPYSLSIIQLKK